MNENENRETLFSLSDLDFYTIIKDILKNWWLILMAGAIGYMAVAVVLQFGFKPEYSSSSTVMITGNAESGNTFSIYSGDAEQFAGILTDEYVLQEVAKDLGLDKLDAEVTAEVVSNTNLLTLTAVSSSPTMSYKIIEGIMDHYTDISEMMFPDYYLYVLRSPSYNSSPVNYLSTEAYQKKAALGGAALMALLLAVCSVLYDNVKNEHDVEEKLDSRLYGSVYHEKKKRSLFRKNKMALLVTSPIISAGFNESYRRMRERLTARLRRSGKKVVLITSMLENEGKSTVAVNLALSLASVSDKVMLIDADLRKPAQYKLLSLDQTKVKALSSYLNGEATLDQCIYHSDTQNLSIMAEFNGSARSSEIIDTPRMEALLNQMREKMDYIILDTPPMAQVSDAEGLARLADYSLLVLRPDNAKTEAINECIADLEACNAKLLGIVLNNIQTLGRWVWQNLHIDLSRVFVMDNNNSSYGYSSNYGSYGYGYGYGKEKKKSGKKENGVQSSGAKDNSFFKEEVKTEDETEMEENN